MNYVILDLVLCDGDVLQNDLQPHCHHACHPVDQAGADVTGHPPLKPEKNKTFTLGITAAVFSVDCLLVSFVLLLWNYPLLKVFKDLFDRYHC